MNILDSIANSPALALWGAGVLVVLFLAVPIALRVAGLSGGQIVALLKYTASVFVQLVRAYRCQEEKTPPKIDLGN